MQAIVSVTADWGIGYEGKLLVRNAADMRRFRELTWGGTVICGRRTFETFPKGALPGRKNIVVTTDVAYGALNIEVAHSPDAALALVADSDPDTVWLIGGAALYRQLLGTCTRAYVTRHDCVRPADAFFPDLDADPSWQLLGTPERHVTPEGIPFAFEVFERTGDAETRR